MLIPKAGGEGPWNVRLEAEFEEEGQGGEGPRNARFETEFEKVGPGRDIGMPVLAMSSRGDQHGRRSYRCAISSSSLDQHSEVPRLPH